MLGIVCGIGILLMGLIISYEVVCRYVFNSPTRWTQEVSIYLFMWTMLAASSYTLQVGKHVRVDLVIEHMQPKTRNIFEVITGVIGMIYCAIISVQAYEMLHMSIKYEKLSATLLRVPLWIPQSALLIGFVLLTFQFLLIVLKSIMEARDCPK
jgi:TRAP-type C4-dicarboxylate transport system permease small subunit